MGTEPGCAHGPEGSRKPQILGGAVPFDIRIMVGHKAPCAVHAFRHLPSVGHHSFQQCKQRQVALGQIAAFRRPVIHLRIDIDGVFRSPGRSKILIPKSLQGQGQRARAASRNHEIPSVLEQQLLKRDVLTTLRQKSQSLIGGHVLPLIPGQTKLHPVVQRLIIRNMFCFHAFKVLTGSGCQLLCHAAL